MSDDKTKLRGQLWYVPTQKSLHINESGGQERGLYINLETHLLDDVWQLFKFSTNFEVTSNIFLYRNIVTYKGCGVHPGAFKINTYVMYGLSPGKPSLLIPVTIFLCIHAWLPFNNCSSKSS